jgi:hypothetical protein
MLKLEYKLYKTKSKLSSMLSAVNLLQISQQAQNQPQQLHSYFILIEFKQNSRQNDCEMAADDGFDSIWFNRNNGEIQFKKSKQMIL